MEAAKQEKPSATQNWADMEHEDEEDTEIGVQGAEEKKTEATQEAAATQEPTQATEGAEGKKPYRQRKDYGDKYDPNYRQNKKGPWRKG
jgi:hypothetical protein